MIPPGFVQVQNSYRNVCDMPRIIGTEVVRTWKAKIIDGCKTYINGEWATCRFWIVHGKELGLSPSDFKVLEKFLNFYDKFVKNMGFPQIINDSLLFLPPQFNKLPDPIFEFPILVKQSVIRKGKESENVILESLSDKPIPKERFYIPSKYSKILISPPKL